MSVRNTQSTVMTGLNSRSADKVVLNMLVIKYSTRDITAENAMNIYLQRQLCVHKAKVHDKRGMRPRLRPRRRQRPENNVLEANMSSILIIMKIV